MKTAQAKPMLEKPRYAIKTDVPHIIKCEQSKTEIDQYFEVEVLREDALNEAGLLRLIQQRRDEKDNTYDTRTVVVETKLTAYQRLLVGAITWEMQPDGYEIVFLTVHPDAPPETRETLIKGLMAKVDANDRLRKNLRYYVRDGEWDTLRVLQGLKWDVKLIADHFPGQVDGYLCTFVSKTHGKSNNEAMEGV